MSQPSWTPPAAPASKIQPALIGGAILGLLSALLSAIPIVSSCCCLWAILGGLLATYLYIKKSPTPVRPGEGAVLGVLAGVIGALIFLVIAVPLNYLVGGDAIESQLRRGGIDIPASGILLILISEMIVAFFLIVLSVLGGLLGVPIFEKRKNGAGTAAPPPPPSFGT